MEDKQTPKDSYPYRKAMRAFFATCNAKGLSEDDRRAIVESYGHESTKEMTLQEFVEATKALNERETTTEERNKWIRRCFAVVYEHCECNGYGKVSSEYVKSIITTSARAVSFSKLDTRDLKRVYNAFLKKKKKQENETGHVQGVV